MPGTDYDIDLLTGIAQHLATQSLGIWNPAGMYTADETGIVLDTMPQSPDNVIVLSSYGVSDDPSQATTIVGLQIRSRTAGRDPRTYRRLSADIAFDLHGRTHLSLSTGLQVTQLLRQSWVSGGLDGNGRWSMIQNFYAWLSVPALHNFTTPEVTP